MERYWPNLRTVALLAAGSVFVHELRYGGSAGEALTVLAGRAPPAG